MEVKDRSKQNQSVKAGNVEVAMGVKARSG